MARLRWAFALAAVAGLALGACSDDGDEAQEVEAGAESSESTTSDAGATEATASQSNGSAGSEELSKLLEEAEQRRYYVAYRVTDQSGDESTFVRAQDPPKLLIGSNDSVTIVLEDKAFQCDTSSGARTCQELPKEAADALAGAGAFGILDIGPELAAEAEKSSAFVDQRDESIAGRDARCYDIDATKVPGVPADAESFTYCVDRELGVTLRFEVSGQLVEATEVREPTEADFATS